jgi:hypothetical protein
MCSTASNWMQGILIPGPKHLKKRLKLSSTTELLCPQTFHCPLCIQILQMPFSSASRTCLEP